MTNIKNKLEPISKEEMQAFVDNYIKEQEEKRWKKEKRFDDFLNYLIQYTHNNKYVDSDSFYYNEDKSSPYSYREFENYLSSLYDIVNLYAKTNFIPDEFNLGEEDYFTENSYCLKINKCFYCIKLVVGQGSYISFELIDSNNDYAYIDYDLMINDIKSPYYEENIKKEFLFSLELLINDFTKRGAKQDILINILKNFTY